MRRFSIRTLMALVLVSAVGLAAIRNANELWAKVMTIVALAFVCVAVVWAILRCGRERAWWLGFAVLGGVYLFVSFSPLRYRLGTTHLLEYVHAKVAGSSIATFEISRFDQNSILYRIVTTDGGVSERTVANSVYYSTPGQDFLVSMAPPNRWRSMLPGAVNFDAFQRVGHSLFALLAGLMGGTVAVWFYARRERAGATEPGTAHQGA
jgi:hypothetical protein